MAKQEHLCGYVKWKMVTCVCVGVCVWGWGGWWRSQSSWNQSNVWCFFFSLGNRTPTPSPGPSYWPDARYSSAQVVSTPILIIATNISGSRASVSTCQPPKVFLKPTESVRPVFQFATGILLHFMENHDDSVINLYLPSHSSLYPILVYASLLRRHPSSHWLFLL